MEFESIVMSRAPFPGSFPLQVTLTPLGHALAHGRMNGVVPACVDGADFKQIVFVRMPDPEDVAGSFQWFAANQYNLKQEAIRRLTEPVGARN